MFHATVKDGAFDDQAKTLKKEYDQVKLRKATSFCSLDDADPAFARDSEVLIEAQTFA